MKQKQKEHTRHYKSGKTTIVNKGNKDETLMAKLSRAFFRGMSANKSGIPRVPIQDPELMELLKGVPLGDKRIAIYKEWQKGWDAENITKPVPAVKLNPKPKIPVKKVIIEWREGPIAESNTYPREFTSIQAANNQLLLNSHTAPATGGYDKHGIKIIWEDGEEYTGRWDVKHVSQSNPDILIGKHIKDFMNYLINKDTTISAEKKKEYQEFMDKHDMED